MFKQNLKSIEDRLEMKVKRRDNKKGKKRTMKVSGAGVKKLQRLIISK